MSTPANPHDALFKALTDNPDDTGVLVRALLPPAIRERLSEDLPVLQDGSFVDDDLRESRSDRLYQVTLTSGRPAMLYVLLEHKSTPDPQTPLQVLGYMVRIWRRHVGKTVLKDLPPILPVVLYHGAQAWQVPTSIFDCLDLGGDDLAPLFRDLRYVTRDLERTPDETFPTQSHVRSVLLTLKYVSRGDVTDDLLARIMVGLEDGSVLERQTISYILTMVGGLDRDRWHRIAATARPGREDTLVSLAAQEWLKEGEAKGIAQGIAQGKIEGEATLLLKLLQRRYGPALEDRHRSVIRSADVAQLEAWGEAVFDAQDIDTLLGTKGH